MFFLYLRLCIKAHTHTPLEMELPIFHLRHSNTVVGIATGIFIAQVLAKTFASTLLPFDERMFGNLPLAMARAMQTTMHKDTVYMPTTIALLRHHRL